MANSALISVKNLSFSTRDGRALAHNLSFELRPGEALVISGENGSGKSTLLRLLLGLSNEFSGTIDRNSEEIGYLPQLQDNDFHIPMRLSDILWISSSESSASNAFPKLLSPDRLNLSWNQASGGEKKRTLLARILLQSPKIIVLDEPFNHLDQISRMTIVESLSEFVSESPGERAIIIVTHEKLFQSDSFSLPIREVKL